MIYADGTQKRGRWSTGKLETWLKMESDSDEEL